MIVFYPLTFAEESPLSVTDSGVEDVDSSVGSSSRTSSRYGSVFQVSSHSYVLLFLPSVSNGLEQHLTSALVSSIN